MCAQRALRAGMRQSVVLSTAHRAGQGGYWSDPCMGSYTWPGSSWRLSACEIEVIATRPQVLGASAPEARYEQTSHSYVSRICDIRRGTSLGTWNQVLRSRVTVPSLRATVCMTGAGDALRPPRHRRHVVFSRAAAHCMLTCDSERQVYAVAEDNSACHGSTLVASCAFVRIPDDMFLLQDEAVRLVSLPSAQLP